VTCPERPVDQADNPSACSEDHRYLVYGEVAERIEAAIREGRAPDLAALERQYPGMGDEIRKFAEALKLLDEFGGSADSLPLALARGGNGEMSLGRLGDFQLLREIGRGGMGIVFEAEQLSLRRRVALKVLPFAAVLDPQHLQRFKNEAQAAASLDHPNIVTVYSVGCERGVHYYAMQYVEGQTLTAIIEGLKTSPDPAAETGGAAPSTTRLSKSWGSREFYRGAARLGIQAADALEHAHRMGIVHRDIKPSNLMVDAEGRLWVTDFGLALSGADGKLTLTGDLVGTLRYMSPEQVEGSRQILDHATDVYSLGVTLYELLAFRPAVTSTDRHEAMHQIVEHAPRPLVELDHAIPRDLETIVLKCIAKDPSERYTTARDLAEDLRLFVDDRPILARRPSLADRAARWSRRHRSLVWLTAVAVVIVTLVSAASAILVLNAYEREKELRATAEENAIAARQNYEIARDAIGRMLDRVADAGLAKAPGMQEIRRRLLDDAAVFCSEVLRRNPQDAGAHIREHLALRYFESQQYDRAIAEATTAIDRFGGKENEASDPRGFFKYEVRADAYAALKKYEEALADYDRALALVPSRPWLYTGRARACFHLARYDNALADLAKAVELNPADYSNLLSIPLDLVAECPDRRFREGILEVADKVLRSNPEHYWVWSSLCSRLAPDKFRRGLDNILQREPGSAADLGVRACAFAAREQWADAIANREKVLVLQPSSASAYNDLAYTLANCGDPRLWRPERAVELAKKAVSLDPKGGGYWHTLATSQYRAGDYRGAIESATVAMDLQAGGGPLDWYVLAMAQWKIGNMDEARRWYRKIDERPDDSKSLRRFRAEAAQLLGIPNVPPAAQKKEANAKK
jgi:eukaryotic-like serine/threonine-protein kinase